MISWKVCFKRIMYVLKILFYKLFLKKSFNVFWNIILLWKSCFRNSILKIVFCKISILSIQVTFIKNKIVILNIMGAIRNYGSGGRKGQNKNCRAPFYFFSGINILQCDFWTIKTYEAIASCTTSLHPIPVEKRKMHLMYYFFIADSLIQNGLLIFVSGFLFPNTKNSSRYTFLECIIFKAVSSCTPTFFFLHPHNVM